MSKKRKRTKKRQKPTSAKELFELCKWELAELNRRYESLFRFVRDPKTYSPLGFTQEIIDVTIERDMKAGDTLRVRIPMKFQV